MNAAIGRVMIAIIVIVVSDSKGMVAIDAVAIGGSGMIARNGTIATFFEPHGLYDRQRFHIPPAIVANTIGIQVSEFKVELGIF